MGTASMCVVTESMESSKGDVVTGSSKGDEGLIVEEPQTTCVVCLSEIDEGDEGLIEECGHKFCFSCIQQWGEQEILCPLCKTGFCEIRKSDGTSVCVKDRRQE